MSIIWNYLFSDGFYVPDKTSRKKEIQCLWFEVIINGLESQQACHAWTFWDLYKLCSNLVSLFLEEPLQVTQKPEKRRLSPEKGSLFELGFIQESPSRFEQYKNGKSLRISSICILRNFQDLLWFLSCNKPGFRMGTLASLWFLLDPVIVRDLTTD